MRCFNVYDLLSRSIICITFLISTTSGFTSGPIRTTASLTALQTSSQSQEPIASPPPISTYDTDEQFIRLALESATKPNSSDDTTTRSSAFPAPTVGAVLVASDGTTVLGTAVSDYKTEAIRGCLRNAGFTISLTSNDDSTMDAEWKVESPAGASRQSTLYVTLEPSTRRRGTALPPVTDLLKKVVGVVNRIVIGTPCPVAEKAGRGAKILKEAGFDVRMGGILDEECRELIEDFSELANCKLQRMAREHYQSTGRPLGFLHCSVIESDNIEAFARHGNAFGTSFGTTRLSFRDFGSYELAPPPDHLWAEEEDEIYDVDFEEEVSQYEESVSSPIIMPWYEQADAVVVTFPRFGNGPPDDNSVKARLSGVKWLASQDALLPAGVERIVVMDTTELLSLPLSNSDPNVPDGVDMEGFWKAKDRKPTRVLLRRGVHESSRAAATAASEAAQVAAAAAQAALEAVETGDVTKATEIAKESRAKAEAAAQAIQKQLDDIQEIRTKLQGMGAVVETLEGREPIDVMKYLGEKNGLYTVVWRAGCWGNRGVRAILAGAFQCVSAHLAVDAIGGQFWQLIIAENAIQAACGPRSQVQVLADDLSLEYCDDPAVDTDVDCNLTVNGGRPVRLVRVDCRVGLVDHSKPADIIRPKTAKLDDTRLLEQAPWFL